MTENEFRTALKTLLDTAGADLGESEVLEILAGYFLQAEPLYHRIGALPSYLPGEASPSKVARLRYVRADGTIIYEAVFAASDSIPWYNGPSIHGESTVHLEWAQGMGTTRRA
jgi:hypothetical protein